MHTVIVIGIKLNATYGWFKLNIGKGHSFSIYQLSTMCNVLNQCCALSRQNFNVFFTSKTCVAFLPTFEWMCV